MVADSARKRPAKAYPVAEPGEAARSAAQQPRPMPRAVAPDDRLLRTRDVLAVIGVCRGTLHNMVRDKIFPKPIKQGRHSRWLKSDADAYMRTLLAKCETEPAAREAHAA